MPVIVAWLVGALVTAAGEMAIRALIGLGVGFATYTASSLALAGARAAIGGQFAHAGPLAAWAGYLKIDVAITIVLSAWVGRMAVTAGKAFLIKKRAS
jgi:hypothetical protein